MKLIAALIASLMFILPLGSCSLTDHGNAVSGDPPTAEEAALDREIAQITTALEDNSLEWSRTTLKEIKKQYGIGKTMLWKKGERSPSVGLEEMFVSETKKGKVRILFLSRFAKNGNQRFSLYSLYIYSTKDKTGQLHRLPSRQLELSEIAYRISKAIEN
jgi:hypothetical protein